MTVEAVQQDRLGTEYLVDEAELEQQRMGNEVFVNGQVGNIGGIIGPALCQRQDVVPLSVNG